MFRCSTRLLAIDIWSFIFILQLPLTYEILSSFFNCLQTIFKIILNYSIIIKQAGEKKMIISFKIARNTMCISTCFESVIGLVLLKLTWISRFNRCWGGYRWRFLPNFGRYGRIICHNPIRQRHKAAGSVTVTFEFCKAQSRSWIPIW